MSNAAKSRTQLRKNGRSSVKTETSSRNTDGQIDGEFLLPEHWINFGERHRLSNRELEILVLTSCGLTRNAMARQLRISFNTVHKFIDRLHKKIRVKDRVALMLRLVQFSRACH